MSSTGSIVIGVFLMLALLGATINFVLVPMMQSVNESAAKIDVGSVSRTNQTGNQTAKYDSAEAGLFGDPAQQINTLLVILGVSAGVATVAAVAGFLVGGSEAALKAGAIAGLLVPLALIMVNVLIAAQTFFNDIPHVGPGAFIMLVAVTLAALLYAAAGFLAGGSSG